MPRMYFLGVETRASSAHRYFPLWSQILGIGDAELIGLDAPPGAPRERIREMVMRVRDDPDSHGALVTTHKVAVYEHAHDLFRDFNPDGELLREAGCIVRLGDGLHGVAVDTVSCALPIRAITAGKRIDSDVLIFGAGGAGRALAVHLTRHHSPRRLVVTDVSPERLRETAAIVNIAAAPADRNDELLANMGRGTLVINASGLGKDIPGSPITAAARFPADAIAWDLNYRGDLKFLEYASDEGARCENGWIYFISGWMHIIAQVFGVALGADKLERAVAETRR